MAITEQQKLEIVEAHRGTLENEQYAAELDLGLAEQSDVEELQKEPKERLAEIQAKLDFLDEKAKEAEAEGGSEG